MKRNVIALFLFVAVGLWSGVPSNVFASHVETHINADLAAASVENVDNNSGSSTGANIAKGCAGGAAVGTLVLPGLGTLFFGGVGCAIAWWVSG